ncbi:MAG: hypothetical protein ABTR07_13555 [Candidatus Competibacter denitrificans]
MMRQPAPRLMRLPYWIFGIGLQCLSLSAIASFNGPLDLGFLGTFIPAFIIATPGAIIIFFAEKIGANHRPRPLFGVIAIMVTLYAAGLAHGSDSSHRNPLFLLLIPPASAIALVTFVRKAPLRLATTWGLTLAGLFLGYIGLHGDFPGIVRNSDELLGMLCGGAATSLLFWYIGFYFGQRKP